MSIDVNKARAETPGCANVLHFNNAGAALMPAPVIDAIQSHIQLESEIGGYEARAAADEKYRGTYEAIARLLNCDASEIALVENATRAWDQVFYGMPFQEGDTVLTAQASYASNYLAMLHMGTRKRINIKVVPNDEHGQVSIEELEEEIDDSVRLIALTHVPTNSGLVNPAVEVGKVARKHGIPYLLDACQSVGQLPVDVQKIGCNFLSATGRKYLRGPRGTGFLYVRLDSIELLHPPVIDLHSATWTSRDEYEWQPGARRFENWESNVAGNIALGTAINYALEWGADEIWDRVRALGELLRAELAKIPELTVHDIGKEKGGIVTFSAQNKASTEIKTWLSALKMNVVTSTPEYARLDAEARNLPETVRASVHYYNTEEEIGRFVFAVRSFLGGS